MSSKTVAQIRAENLETMTPANRQAIKPEETPLFQQTLRKDRARARLVRSLVSSR